jgi:hypothetical protein
VLRAGDAGFDGDVLAAYPPGALEGIIVVHDPSVGVSVRNYKRNNALDVAVAAS